MAIHQDPRKEKKERGEREREREGGGGGGWQKDRRRERGEGEWKDQDCWRMVLDLVLAGLLGNILHTEETADANVERRRAK